MAYSTSAATNPNPGSPLKRVAPVKGRLDLTYSLVAQLEPDRYDAIFVLDNGSGDETWNWLCSRPRELALQAVDATGLGIYAMWNLGIRLARERSPVCNVAILNNDIRLGSHFLDRLAAGLRSSPELWAASANYDGRRIEGVEYVQASFKSGGFAGFAFMTRGESSTPSRSTKGSAGGMATTISSPRSSCPGDESGSSDQRRWST